MNISEIYVENLVRFVLILIFFILIIEIIIIFNGVTLRLKVLIFIFVVIPLGIVILGIELGWIESVVFLVNQTVQSVVIFVSVIDEELLLSLTVNNVSLRPSRKNCMRCAKMKNRITRMRQFFLSSRLWPSA